MKDAQKFLRVSLAGNEFLLVEGKVSKKALQERVLSLSERIDGVLLTLPLSEEKVRMIYYDVNRKTGEIKRERMCGNGLIATGTYYLKKLERGGIFVKTDAGTRLCVRENGRVWAEIRNVKRRGDIISVEGVRHFILKNFEVQSLEACRQALSLMRKEKNACASTLFRGRLVTYETGVEDITGACGTACVAYTYQKGVKKCVLTTRSGRKINVRWSDDLKHVFISGGVGGI